MENSITRTAVVTGGSRGIGRQICIELASRGISIMTCYAHNSAEADITVSMCEKFGVKAVAVHADVQSAEDVNKLFSIASEKLGRVDILVNNAGITRDNLMLRMSEEDFMSVIDTNLKGAFLCSKAASAMMLKRRYGRIINISSVVGVRGNAGQVNYSASKAGIIGLTKSAAKELAGKNITVNAIAPGYISTDMSNALPDSVKESIEKTIPMKHVGSPEDVAALAGFLASDLASYITGQVICVDGGMAI